MKGDDPFSAPASPASDGLADWRARIAANLKRASAQRIRALFAEINPGLVGDKLFEDRWSDIRREAAVLVPIIARTEGATVLLTVRSSDMPSHAGQISFPGGKIEEKDSGPVAAALREACEEVNIRPDLVEIIGTLGVHQGGLGFSVTPVVGVVDPAADIRPCPREVAEVFEVPLAFFADLGNHLTEQREHKGVRYNMFAAPFGRYHIWGLTAGILRTLAETLQDDETALTP
ncbi:MAG: CoA pyrophosphatase [Pseudomonadota bacterium]|nr:CoA pyrophosphatase [Pseudomonadota bacterium]